MSPRFLSERPAVSGSPSHNEFYRSKSSFSYRRHPASSHSDSLGVTESDMPSFSMEELSLAPLKSTKRRVQDQPGHLPVNKESLLSLNKDLSMGMSTYDEYKNGKLDAYDTIDGKLPERVQELVQESVQEPVQEQTQELVQELAQEPIVETLPRRDAESKHSTDAFNTGSTLSAFNTLDTERLQAETASEEESALHLPCVFEEQEKNNELKARILAEMSGRLGPQPPQEFFLDDIVTNQAVSPFLDTSPNGSTLMVTAPQSAFSFVNSASATSDRISPDVLPAQAEPLENSHSAELEPNNEPVDPNISRMEVNVNEEAETVYDRSSLSSSMFRSSDQSLESKPGTRLNRAVAAAMYDFSADEESEASEGGYTRTTYAQDDMYGYDEWEKHPSRFPSYDGRE